MLELTPLNRASQKIRGLTSEFGLLPETTTTATEDIVAYSVEERERKYFKVDVES